MSGIVNVIYLAVTVYAWLIVARAVMSWLNLRPGNAAYSIYKVLIDVTEPYLRIFRRVIPMPRIGGAAIDLSSVVALIVLFIVLQILPYL
jgi:YggT family protein